MTVPLLTLVVVVVVVVVIIIIVTVMKELQKIAILDTVHLLWKMLM